MYVGVCQSNSHCRNSESYIRQQFPFFTTTRYVFRIHKYVLFTALNAALGAQHSETHILTATTCTTLQHTCARQLAMLLEAQHTATRILIATHCNTHICPHCNILQHTATQRNTIQHTATRHNMLQHTRTGQRNAAPGTQHNTHTVSFIPQHPF